VQHLQVEVRWSATALTEVETPRWANNCQAANFRSKDVQSERMPNAEIVHDGQANMRIPATN